MLKTNFADRRPPNAVSSSAHLGVRAAEREHGRQATCGDDFCGMCSAMTVDRVVAQLVEVERLLVGEDPPRRALVEHLLERGVRDRRHELEGRRDAVADRLDDARRGPPAARSRRRRAPSPARSGTPRGRTARAARSGRRSARRCRPGSWSTKSRMNRSTSTPWSTVQKNRPRFTSGPTSWSANSNSVTTPKLPPPPRSAQNRSAFSSADACTIRPSAVTTVAPTRLSHAQAELAAQPADAAAEREPADTGVADHAADGGEPVLLGGRVELGPRRAAATARPARRRRRPSRAFIRLRSIMSPPSQQPWPA